MKPSVLLGSSIIVILLISAAAFISKQNQIPRNHIEVVLREVGHQVLLRAKDSSSRVLPVKKVNEDTYQISFQNEFRLVSDTLINLVQRTFQKNGLAGNYIVRLKNCGQQEAVFAFEINNGAGDVIPCRGRKLEVGCYRIEIDFLKTVGFNFSWFLLLMIPLILMGIYVKDKLRKKEEKESIAGHDYIPLGKFRFYAGYRVLKTENSSIALSENEAKALEIFAENTDQVVDRETLMKAIWEEKGVVVISRNVDVLVSKLRKKLSGDASIKIINVPGRGYRFMME